MQAFVSGLKPAPDVANDSRAEGMCRWIQRIYTTRPNGYILEQDVREAEQRYEPSEGNLPGVIHAEV